MAAEAQHEVQFAEVTPITETPLSHQAAISIHIAGATVDIHSGAETATRRNDTSGFEVMLNDFAGADKVYIACSYTDLRKGIDGLARMV